MLNSQIIDYSVSAFSSYLHQACRSASGESLGSSQIFSDISCAGHACCFLHAFECPNIPKKCSPWLFLLGFKQAIVCLNCNMLPQVKVSLFKNCFLNMFSSSAYCFSSLSKLQDRQTRDEHLVLALHDGPQVSDKQVICDLSIYTLFHWN